MGRLRAGLPDTPLNNIQRLLLAVVIKAITDDDVNFVLSPGFAGMLGALGVNSEMVHRVRVAYLRGTFDPTRLWEKSVGARRFPDKTVDDGSQWESWPAVGW